MTWTPTEQHIADALKHAAACDPLECCGVIADGVFMPITNNATDFDTFVMNMTEYLAIAKTHQIDAIVHSHIYAPPIPSEADKAMCEATGKPWLIISHPNGKWTVTEPSGYKAPLVGRQWAYGAHDCYGCVRDGFAFFSGVTIPDFPRDWLWWDNGENIIVEQFAEAGFREVSGEWRHCDVIGMQIWPAKVVNHLGLFVHPDIMLHHMFGRLSAREVYGGVYAMATVLHLRHEKFLDAPPPLPEGYTPWGWS
jgi:proteasome lid subunit RPN8/RPN11